MTRVYLAAWFSRQADMRARADELAIAGHVNVASWVHEPPGMAMSAQWALQDLHDLCDADVLVLFTETPDKGYMTGGRHVELGYALANDKRVCIVGPRENIFHYLPQVEQFDTWDQCLAAL